MSLPILDIDRLAAQLPIHFCDNVDIFVFEMPLPLGELVMGGARKSHVLTKASLGPVLGNDARGKYLVFLRLVAVEQQQYCVVWQAEPGTSGVLVEGHDAHDVLVPFGQAGHVRGVEDRLHNLT